MYLGIDGGGTRCRARIEDQSARVLGAASSGPATTRIGFEKAWRAVAWSEEARATDYAAFAPIVMRHANQGDPVGRRIVERAANAIGDLLDLFLARGIGRLSLVGGLADAITPWLTPDLRARLGCPDADAAAGALLVARGRLDLPKRETDHEQASKFRV